jgi:tRNA pseudouridine38-40 synthase
MTPRSLKITLAYDGTDFAGWQRQAEARTVQAAIEDALQPIEGQRAVVIGAGRTDAGVHAAAQVASVRVKSPLPCDVLRRALNATLPADVRVLAVEDAAPDFNAQFAATAKTYRYDLWSGAVLPPVIRRTAWHIPPALDVGLMDVAAQSIVGVHDFAGFQASGSDVLTTVREIVASSVFRAHLIPLFPENVARADPGLLLRYEVTGTGFLRHMVRTIVGTLVEIGRGWRPADDMRRILASRNRAEAGATAPAHGLTLWGVHY